MASSGFPDRAEGVGPGDDDEVRIQTIAHVDGRAELAHGLLAAHQRLARDAAAALGKRWSSMWIPATLSS